MRSCPRFRTEHMNEFSHASTKARRKNFPNEVRMVIAFVAHGRDSGGDTVRLQEAGHCAPPRRRPRRRRRRLPLPPAPLFARGCLLAGCNHSERNADDSVGSRCRHNASPPLPSAVSAASEQNSTLDTGLYHVVFSNRGAVVKSWTLKNFKDSDGKPLELVNQKGAEKVGFPFCFTFRGKQPGVGSEQSPLGRSSGRDHASASISPMADRTRQRLSPSARRLHGAVFGRSDAERRRTSPSG